MVKLDEGQKDSLEEIRDVAWRRHVLEQEVEKEMKRVRARIYGQWETQMTQVVSAAKNLGVPNRQIGLAYGTTNNKTSRGIVEKFWKLDRFGNPLDAPKNEMFEDEEMN